MRLPPDTRSAVITSPDHGATVIICRAPREPSPSMVQAALRGRQEIAAGVFRPGVQWPDAAGLLTAETVLGAGGVAVWEFCRTVDALVAQRRLREIIEGGAS